MKITNDLVTDAEPRYELFSLAARPVTAEKSFMEAWKEARALREQTHPDDVDGGTFTWEGRPGTIFYTSSPTAHVKKYEHKEIKAYWLREEICIADELLELVPKLREEFLEQHPNFLHPSLPIEMKAYRHPLFSTEKNVMGGLDAWLTDGVKYTWKAADIYVNVQDDPTVVKRYPTACALTRRWGDDNPLSSYSCIEPGKVIERHTGVENRDNEFIRIHIPLIIPEGDVFFECEGVEIDWTDIWAFDNQLVHSAHNYSNQRRLIYMFDVRRDKIGLPLGEKYDKLRQIKAKPFVRGQYPKVLHRHQRPA